MDHAIAVAYRTSFSALSRAVVGGTLRRRRDGQRQRRFSALSRAVVGGTLPDDEKISDLNGFSALSRAVVGGTLWRRK